MRSSLQAIQSAYEKSVNFAERPLQHEHRARGKDWDLWELQFGNADFEGILSQLDVRLGELERDRRGGERRAVTSEPIDDAITAYRHEPCRRLRLPRQAAKGGLDEIRGWISPPSYESLSHGPMLAFPSPTASRIVANTTPTATQDIQTPARVKARYIPHEQLNPLTEANLRSFEAQVQRFSSLQIIREELEESRVPPEVTAPAPEAPASRYAFAGPGKRPRRPSIGHHRNAASGIAFTDPFARNPLRGFAIPDLVVSNPYVEPSSGLRIGPSHLLKCSVCLEDVELSGFPKPLHGDRTSHLSNTCAECWRQHTRVVVGSGVTVLRCADQDCREHLSVDDVRLTAEKEVYDQHLENLDLAFLKSQANYRECPSATCTYGHIQDDGHIFICAVCGLRYCTSCEVPMHEGETCAAYLRRWAKRPVDSATAKYLVKHTKQCPNCSIHIKKNGGCDHMTCSTCSHEFCWQCSAPYAGSEGIRAVGNTAHGAVCQYHS